MKNLFAFFFLALFSVTLFAQEEDLDVSNRFGKADRLMIDLYNDTWLGAPDTIDFKGYNPGVAFNVVKDFPFGATNFSFAIGIGVGTHNMRYNASIYTDPVSFENYFVNRVDTPKQYKMVLSYIDIPAEIRFRTKRDNVFRIAIGGKIGYNINNHIKHVDDDFKVKTYEVPYLNMLRYGVTARVGYKMFNLYVYYGLSTLFEEKHGPEMAPLSIGISLIPF